jgi:hypothetical protein
MPYEDTTHPSMEVVNGASVALVGGGIVTIALFPLALPILILTLIAVIPFLVPVLALGLLAIIVRLPIRMLRRLRRRDWPSGRAGRHRADVADRTLPRAERARPASVPAPQAQ